MQLTYAFKKYLAFLAVLFLIGAQSTVCKAGDRSDSDTLIIIPFGKKNEIRYSIYDGAYHVVYGGQRVITSAVAEYRGNVSIKSSDATTRRYSSSVISDNWGKGKLHVFEQTTNGLRLQQLFYVYANQPFFFTQVRVYGKNIAANYISPLTTTVQVEGTGDKRALVVPFDNDMWARFDAQPIDKADYTGSEVTALYNNDTRRGLIIGSVEHTVWKTGIKVGHKNNNTLTLAAYGGLADSTITHDKIPHGKVAINDTLCSSPSIMVGLFDDWRTGMEQYAVASKQAQQRTLFKWNKATPMGWNSWGMMQTSLSLPKAKSVIDFFNDSCKGFRNEAGTLYIDLDSYWDNLVKGGLQGDVSALQQFVAYCREKHFVPGIYWAPFADWGKYDRTIEGSSYTYPASWITQKGIPVEVDGARAMDPTYPGTRQRIVHYINKFKELGFEMIKVDFLGHGAMENDHFYDPAVTTGMQAYKVGMEFLDSVLANKMLVYAAISPTMATAPYVHMRRIACDAFSAIDNSEYTLNSTGYGWWQNKLYDYVDADHVVFNKETPGANRARLASALVTGTLITGDDFSVNGPWNQSARLLLQNKDLLAIIQQGRAFSPVEANTGRRAPEVFVRTINGATYLAIFNYDHTPRKFNITPARIGLKAGSRWQLMELFSGKQSTANGLFEVELPAADAVIYRIAK
jgi:alpha-galactosidase